MHESETEVPTEGLQQLPAKGPTLVKHHALRKNLPLPHGGAQGHNGRPRIETIYQIAAHIPSGIILHEGHLLQLPPGRLIKDFLQAVPMPETMRVIACVEAPLGRGGGGVWACCLACCIRFMVAGLIGMCATFWSAQARRSGPSSGLALMRQRASCFT
jgi:hypothetical protein